MSLTVIINEKKLEIEELNNKIAERHKAQPENIPPFSGKYRLTRGTQVSDSRCEAPFKAGGCGALGGDFSLRQRENVDRWNKINIEPLQVQRENLLKEINALEEKNKIPILRQQLITSTSEYEKLSPNDPEFRQKQIDQKKSLYEKAVALDALERKHNLFGNLPTSKREPEIIIPEPITVYKEPEIIEKSITIGTAEFDYKKLAIAGAGIFAVLALILWRLK
jgi:hypothetical protein